MPRKFYVYDIYLNLEGFNDDIYTATYDKEMYINVPDLYQSESDVEEYIAIYLKESVEPEVDTPDWCEVYCTDAEFSFELVDEEFVNDDPAVDLYVEQLQMERKGLL